MNILFRNKWNLPAGVKACLLLLSLQFCGGGSSSGGNSGGGAPAISISLSEVNPIVTQGRLHGFGATVSGAADTRVLWSVAEPNGGSIDANGTYRAPNNAGVFTIVATSVANPSVKATASATVVPAPQILSFSATPAFILPGQNASLSASYSNGVATVDHGVGPLQPSQSSVSVSPAATTIYILTVSNAAGESVTAAVQVSVDGNIATTIFPANVSLAPGANQSFLANVTGAHDSGVNWSVVEVGGGTVDTQGNYTAPNVTGTYHLVASSLQNPNSKAIATITVKAPVVSLLIAPGEATLATGGSQKFIAYVTGTTNTNVIWSVTEAGGGAIDDSGLYHAPVTTGTYHITARSVADSSVLSTVAVTVKTPDSGQPLMNWYPEGTMGGNLSGSTHTDMRMVRLASGKVFAAWIANSLFYAIYDPTSGWSTAQTISNTINSNRLSIGHANSTDKIILITTVPQVTGYLMAQAFTWDPLQGITPVFSLAGGGGVGSVEGNGIACGINDKGDWAVGLNYADYTQGPPYNTKGILKIHLQSGPETTTRLDAPYSYITNFTLLSESLICVGHSDLKQFDLTGKSLYTIPSYPTAASGAGYFSDSGGRFIYTDGASNILEVIYNGGASWTTPTVIRNAPASTLIRGIAVSTNGLASTVATWFETPPGVSGVNNIYGTYNSGTTWSKPVLLAGDGGRYIYQSSLAAMTGRSILVFAETYPFRRLKYLELIENSWSPEAELNWGGGMPAVAQVGENKSFEIIGIEGNRAKFLGINRDMTNGNGFVAIAEYK
jgi:hypothetical protein